MWLGRGQCPRASPIAHGDDRSAEAPWSLSPRGDRPPQATTHGPGWSPRSAGAFDALMTGAAVRALERQPGWAADARLGGYGPASPCRLVVATTDPAGEGHLVPGHQPAPPRRPPMPPPARTCRPTSPRSSASTDCGRGSSRATNRSRTNAAGPTQVRSDRAIRRHQTLVNCAFSFCWDQWFAPPGPLNATTPDPCPNEGPERGPDPSHEPQQPCWPKALRAIRSWLTPAITLNRWWRGWTDKDPPPTFRP